MNEFRHNIQLPTILIHGPKDQWEKTLNAYLSLDQAIALREELDRSIRAYRKMFKKRVR